MVSASNASVGFKLDTRSRIVDNAFEACSWTVTELSSALVSLEAIFLCSLFSKLPSASAISDEFAPVIVAIIPARIRAHCT